MNSPHYLIYLCSNKWETLPQTIQKRETFPRWKNGEFWEIFTPGRLGSSLSGLPALDPPLCPPSHQRNLFGTNVCKVTFKNLPQPLRSHTQNFRTLGQFMEIPLFSIVQGKDLSPKSFWKWNPKSFVDYVACSVGTPSDWFSKPILICNMQSYSFGEMINLASPTCIPFTSCWPL